MKQLQDQNETTHLTEMELEVIKAIKASDFYEQGEDSVVWDYSVYDALPFKGKVRSGVLSSLVQKEVVGIQKKERGRHCRRDLDYRQGLFLASAMGV